VTPAPAGPARWLWRHLVPGRGRNAIRRTVRDLPNRFRDFVPDLVDRLSLTPLPPPVLRARVGLGSSRREFVDVGTRAAASILGAFDEATSASGSGDYRRWLDFGCGCGRVARSLIDSKSVQRLTGVDIDRPAVSWCRRHLLGEFAVSPPRPPLEFDAGAFDVVCAVSVFTHMSEAEQDAWVAELSRVLRGGGILIATTLSPELTWTRPDLTPAQHAALRDTGFLYAPASERFNDNAAFQTLESQRSRWGKLFALEWSRPFGLVDYLDLSIWKKRPTSPSASSLREVSG
jgi:SAM-dependent methyltransferase